MPGIESVGLADTMPLSLNWNNSTILIEGKPEPKAADVPLAGMFRADSGFWKAAGTRFVAGRPFDDHDAQGTPRWRL